MEGNHETEILTRLQKEGVSRERVVKVLRFLNSHLGDPLVPRIDGPRDFLRKFHAVEEAMNQRKVLGKAVEKHGEHHPQTVQAVGRAYQAVGQALEEAGRKRLLKTRPSVNGGKGNPHRR